MLFGFFYIATGKQFDVCTQHSLEASCCKSWPNCGLTWRGGRRRHFSSWHASRLRWTCGQPVYKLHRSTTCGMEPAYANGVQSPPPPRGGRSDCGSKAKARHQARPPVVLPSDPLAFGWLRRRLATKIVPIGRPNRTGHAVQSKRSRNTRHPYPQWVAEMAGRGMLSGFTSSSPNKVAHSLNGNIVAACPILRVNAMHSSLRTSARTRSTSSLKSL